ncbi:SMP-30/gluconolactonase/LRE family protein [Roseomonas sp. OT10]|uniref:SMP-30/gluconolactonase/LRE family protein n=1 Tax=Roseomonas cutis TaxID=2897332 RepID=UPI001E2DA4AB|nr:SMP-30/gluconolactonase/LRE family protein [Roseomonas sp. OT10]UFN51460.1 SMP-30/gluconolactonase/LRE family protein [Roseomonas sp. OT10]
MRMLTPDGISFVGQDLNRAECVMTTRSGDLFVPDGRGGISVIAADGGITRLLARDAPEGFLPNGIALLPDRSVLIANLGPAGGVWHLARDGALTPRLREVDGRALPPTNFVGIDRQGRTWVTVSTWAVPREQSMRKGYGDGFIVLMDGRGARIVAEGIGFTNEAIVDPSGEWLYVNETIGRRTSRFPIRPDGSLGEKEVFAQYGAGTWPDGFAFDEEGGVWIVSVISNRVIRATPDGRQELILEDADAADVAAAEAAFQEGRFGRPQMDLGRRRGLRNLSGIGFGGPDRRTVYLGSLFGERLASFRSPVAGAPPVHWNF